MVTKTLPVGSRVTHRSVPGFSGVVVGRAETARGRQLASVLVDGQAETRVFLADVLIAA